MNRSLLSLLVILLFIINAGIVSIFHLDDGMFVYTLDDPYIHLQLAKHIASGHYGLNAGEFGSPASSILWPFLLAPFSGFPWNYWLPLFINSVCCLLTAMVLYRVLFPAYSRHAAWVVFILLLATNSVGLVFTGMEHSLQVLLAVFTVGAMIDCTEGRSIHRLLIPTLIVAPLIRYELFALVYGAVLLLWTHQQKRYVLCALAATVLAGLFSIFLWIHGGYGIPASILNKLNNSTNPFNQAMVMVVVGMLSFMVYAFRKHTARKRLFYCLLLAAVLQLCFGKAGWLSRYEIYMIISSLMAIVYYLPLSGLWVDSRPLLKTIFLMVFALCGAFYLLFTASVPMASRAIYSQHIPMAQLVRQSGIPSVAVNDVGYMSYSNNVYVYDLWGLSNPQTHSLLSNADTALFTPITKRHIPLVMFYADIFKHMSLPDSWIRLGTLELTGDVGFMHAIGSRKVAFYATSEQAASKLKRDIETWQVTLPKTAIWKPEYHDADQNKKS